MISTVRLIIFIVGSVGEDEINEIGIFLGKTMGRVGIVIDLTKTWSLPLEDLGLVASKESLASYWKVTNFFLSMNFFWPIFQRGWEFSVEIAFRVYGLGFCRLRLRFAIIKSLIFRVLGLPAPAHSALLVPPQTMCHRQEVGIKT
ncbi:hypothetical protein ACLOJK_022749 [Asimina triloba]